MRSLVEAGTKLRTKLWGTMRSTPRKSHQKSGFRSEKRRPSRREQSVMQQLFKEDNYTQLSANPQKDERNLMEGEQEKLVGC